MEVEVERKIHIFANEFFTDTYVDFQEGETQEQRNKRAVLTAAKWYTEHLGVKLSYNIYKFFYINNII